jgi:peptide/nickel transport system permease protein
MVSIVVFGATNLRSSAHVARATLGQQIAPEQISAFVKERGLDRPIYARYWSWVKNAVRGDLGVSPVTGRPVREDVLPRLAYTAVLTLVTLFVAVPLSVGLGVYMARRTGTLRDLALLIGTFVVAAMPEFVVGIGLLLVVSVKLHVLPVDSTALSFGTLSEKVEAFILPTLTLVFAIAPYLVRMARASVREALNSPYVEAAVLRGLPRRSVIWVHVMPNAAVPLVNAVVVSLVYLLSGVIVVENVFAFPGIGELLVQAIGSGDTVTVQAIALLMGGMFIVSSLTADLLILYLNPRLKATP